MFQRARSRGLSDLLASRTLGLERPQEQQLLTQLMVLRTRIGEAQSRLFALAGDADRANDAQLATIEKQIRTLEGLYETLSARVAAEAPRLQTLVNSQPATLKAFQQALRNEQSEALQYLVLDEGILLWHITPTSVTVKNVFLPRPELMAKVDALRKSLADRSVAFDETTARELFLFLIAPVLSQVRADRLVILPHEDLHYVPFQVFQDRRSPVSRGAVPDFLTPPALPSFCSCRRRLPCQVDVSSRSLTLAFLPPQTKSPPSPGSLPVRAASSRRLLRARPT